MLDFVIMDAIAKYKSVAQNFGSYVVNEIGATENEIKALNNFLAQAENEVNFEGSEVLVIRCRRTENGFNECYKNGVYIPLRWFDNEEVEELALRAHTIGV